jgi:hypothetical protein
MHSTRLKPDQIRDYLARSYTAVDGLWFMKTEERLGFDEALEIDALVWRVMPKIQARQLKSALGADSGLDALAACYAEKLFLDGFDFLIVPTAPPPASGAGPGPDGAGGDGAERELTIRISFCPWVDKLVRSKRGHLAPVIGGRICAAEYAGWAGEFGCAFEFGGDRKLCEEGDSCVLKFRDA